MENCENTASPMVSVIIPTYKRDVKFLSRALDSVLNQSYTNIEAVIIDDSPDSYEHRGAVAAYINRTAQTDKRIRYLRNTENLGGALSRNRGIEAAEGELITFLDDDDEYKPNKIENQVKFMLSSGCDMSFGNMVIYNNSGTVVDRRDYHDITSFDNEELLKYHLVKQITGTPTFMYRAEKLREIKGFDDAKVGQEYFLMFKSIEQGLKIGYTDAYDVIVYKHGQTALSNGTQKISGERFIFDFKKKYFSILTKKQRRTVVFRYNAVTAAAYFRNKKYFNAFCFAIKTFFTAPDIFFQQGIAYISKFIAKAN